MYYNYENGETLTKAQHVANIRDLLENFADLPTDALEDQAEKLAAISQFIETIAPYADDDVLSVTYWEYSNTFTTELV